MASRPWFDPTKVCCWPNCLELRVSASYCRKHYNEYHRDWRSRNREKTASYWQSWLDSHPAALIRRQEARPASEARRREAKSGITKVTVVESAQCAVCNLPLDRKLRRPHPLAVTVGHEPPLSRCREEGLTAVTVRPEHLICNFWKASRLDSELRGPSPATTILVPGGPK